MRLADDWRIRALINMMENAIDVALRNGAEYADVRWSETARQTIFARNNVIATMEDVLQQGLSIRTFFKGAWGYSAANVKTREEAAGLAEKSLKIAKAGTLITKNKIKLTPVKAHASNWSTSVEVDPFEISMQEKTDLLLHINAALLKEKAIQEANAHMRFAKNTKLFLNSIGSNIRQSQTWSEIDYTATAVGKGRFASRGFQGSPKAMGYELVNAELLVKEAPRVAAQALENLSAESFDSDTLDLVLLPNHTRLVIHETIGHATELDRVLGWEAEYAGTSFAVIDYLGQLKYGSPIFNVIADRTQPGGLATCAFDDDGVPAQRWHLIKHGTLVDYATTRDTATFIGSNVSRGCSYADNWNSFPILRMPNVGIEAGSGDAPDLDELISDTQNGILIDGMGSYSIDHQRINFQFGADYCRRIRNGKLGNVLRNVHYEGSNPNFWTKVNAICKQKTWQNLGIWGCAKGQPVQIAALTHGSAPLRLRGISVFGKGK